MSRGAQGAPPPILCSIYIYIYIYIYESGYALAGGLLSRCLLSCGERAYHNVHPGESGAVSYLCPDDPGQNPFSHRVCPCPRLCTGVPVQIRHALPLVCMCSVPLRPLLTYGRLWSMYMGEPGVAPGYGCEWLPTAVLLCA